MELDSQQISTIERLKNGSVLWADVGVGKSRTALAYYYIKVCCGTMEINGKGSWGAPAAPRDLFIITTAKKRDSKEWIKECIPFMVGEDPKLSICGIKVTVDSWNNIQKYRKVVGAFFIFDEQRVTGSGPWVKAFLDITRKNEWILLTATPGDKWIDYIPVFVANGFYRNKTEFMRRHCIFAPYLNYPKVTGYMNKHELMLHRREILVRMRIKKEAVPHHISKLVGYDREKYRIIFRDRWNFYDNEPIDETGKLCYLLRRVVNSDPSRFEALKELVLQYDRVIIFYNYLYEIEMMKQLFADIGKTEVYEWNGQKHQPLPEGDSWIYLVQYNSGAEGWNCITSNVIIFFSENYSYRIMVQAAGRIDRRNTKYKDLYYYHLKSASPIDSAIARALKEKQDFNEADFASA